MGYPMPIGYLPSKVTAQSIVVGTNGDITMGSGAVIKLDPSTSLTSCALQFNGDPNTGLRYGAADNFTLLSGGNFIQSIATQITLWVQANARGGIGFVEQAAPTLVADTGIMYASVDGGSKTDLNVLFQSGAAIKVTEEV